MVLGYTREEKLAKTEQQRASGKVCVDSKKNCTRWHMLGMCYAFQELNAEQILNLQAWDSVKKLILEYEGLKSSLEDVAKVIMCRTLLLLFTSALLLRIRQSLRLLLQRSHQSLTLFQPALTPPQRQK